MPMWNPWRGCRKYSEGCQYCYIHNGDSKRGVNTGAIVRTNGFDVPVQRKKSAEYKMKSGQMVYLCFSTDFLIEEADEWRPECWAMIKMRPDLHFIFLTERIDRFLDCIPEDWGDGYDNVTVGCTVENKRQSDYRLEIFAGLPIKHKNIICQPLLEDLDIEKYLPGIELVVVGEESNRNARPLDYAWVLDIREQCRRQCVHFEFRQCGTHFIKDGRQYTLAVKDLCAQAKRADINL